VKPSGTRLWNQAYRFGGTQKKLSHGAYPSVSLAEARRLRDVAKKLLASGPDPGANTKAAKLRAVISATNTFGGVAEEYPQRIEDEGAAASTVTKNRCLLVDHAGLDLGTRPIADISPAEILTLLQRIERSGPRATARRLRSAIGTVGRLAISTLRAKGRSESSAARRPEGAQDPAPGFRPDVIEAALGHQDQGEIRRPYNRASYWPERIELVQAWAD
jgi:hypothetical protein